MNPANAQPSVLLSIAVLGVLVLAWGAWRTWRGGDRRKAVLMLAAAAVLLGNVLISTI